MKKIRNLELRRIHDRMSLVAKVIPGVEKAAKDAEKVYARVFPEGGEPEPIPFLGFTATTEKDATLSVADTLTIVEAWLIWRWLRTPVLYKPHPALFRALAESEPPKTVDPLALKRIHNQTWAILIPEELAISGRYRFFIGGISKATLTGANDPRSLTEGVATAGIASAIADLGDDWSPEAATVCSLSDADRLSEVYEGGTDEEKKVQRAVINAGLYLASAAPDIDVPDWDPKSRKAGDRALARPRTVGLGGSVGPRLGAMLDMGRAPRERGEALGGHHASPVTHYRRGHWRSVWMGPRKNGEPGTHQLPKWIEPTIVGKGLPGPVQRELR